MPCNDEYSPTTSETRAVVRIPGFQKRRDVPPKPQKHAQTRFLTFDKPDQMSAKKLFLQLGFVDWCSG